MSIDPIKQFVQLRTQLIEEQSRIEARLAAINKALGEAPPPSQNGTVAKASPRTRIKNPMSLAQAIIKVTNSKPLSKQEILDAVKKLGYQFTTDNPLRSIDMALYGKKPKFKRENGKFSVLK